MSVLDEAYSNVVFISGTPCTGKTTVASELNDYLIKEGFDSCFIKINDFAIENDLVLGEDPDKFYKVIDIEKLNEVLNLKINNFLNSDDSESNSNDSKDSQSNSEIQSDKIVIVEGHLSHLCNGADKMIVLRLNPKELEKRLNERNYSASKIHENLEVEALAVCTAEAYEIYGEDTFEIDTSDKSIGEVLDLILKVIYNELEPNVGSIDFMNWFLE